MKVFISGKITGEDISTCMRKFEIAEKVLYGFNVFDKIINPLKIDGIHFGISHDEAMEICFDELKDCTHIYMLKDWQTSVGAKKEYKFAGENNIIVLHEYEFMSVFESKINAEDEKAFFHPSNKIPVFYLYFAVFVAFATQIASYFLFTKF